MIGFAPGQLDPLDLGDFGVAYEPPTLEPLAAAFVQSMSPLRGVLDAAYAALLEELVFSGADVLNGTFETFHTAATTATEAAPTSDGVHDLFAAQAAWDAARVELALTRDWLTSDDYDPSFFHIKGDVNTSPKPTPGTPPTSHPTSTTSTTSTGAATPPVVKLAPGRYKFDDAGACVWDSTDTGPDQCQPETSA